MQQAAILQQQHKQKLQEAPEEGREAQGRKFCKISQLLKDLATAKCSQINYSNSFGTSQKVGLAILKRKTIVINKYSYVQCSTFSSE
jgi:hypothetical protein